MTVEFLKQTAMKPEVMTCPHCSATKRIGMHSHPERRSICHTCGKPFAETKGTVFFGLHYPI